VPLEESSISPSVLAPRRAAPALIGDANAARFVRSSTRRREDRERGRKIDGGKKREKEGWGKREVRDVGRTSSGAPPRRDLAIGKYVARMTTGDGDNDDDTVQEYV